MRRFLAVLSLAVLPAVVAVAVGFMSGYLSLVETHGNSMAPRIATGDLVIVNESGYTVGDVVAYHSKDLEQVVLHRVIGIDGDRYTFQGDHNGFVDPEQPASGQLIGKEWLHIPQGGVWLDHLTSPTALGLLAFGLLAGGGTAARNRRHRRRRTMSQHAAAPRRGIWTMTGLPSWVTTAAALAAVAGVLGVVLGVAAWTMPDTAPAPRAVTADSGQSMTFSYSAQVPESPAYDDTTVTDPEPIFRNLVDTVEVEYSYRGEPGSIAVAAELSSASGWHSTVPLSSPDTFEDPGYTGTVSLDLKGLEKRAQDAAAVTGILASQVDISVVPTVTTAGDKRFAPELVFALTPLQLTLAGEPSSLTVGGDAPGPRTTASATPTLSLAGRELPVSTARTLSLVLAVGGLLAVAVIALLARMSAPRTESAAIQRRYAALLVRVQPISTPAGRPLVDVVDFATLAKLADRYGLLVLHWSRSDVETFVVQDEGTTYRYRTGVGVSLSPSDVLVGTV